MSNPVQYPQGITLHSLGYAALKSPELAPELPIPFSTQLGVLQRSPMEAQQRMMAQIGSQYLPALLEHECGNDAASDLSASSGAPRFSDAMTLINYLSSNPDIAGHLWKHPTIFQNILDKLLIPEIDTIWSENSLGSALQFISTLLIQDSEEKAMTVYPGLKELPPHLRTYLRKYRGKYVAKVSERLKDQLKSANPTMKKMILEVTRSQLRCGYVMCSNNEDMRLCGSCGVQRYCCPEHQKKDWKFHKTICIKGLVENEIKT